jgi:ABC-type transport system involved in multi-copper enzyme maturation permease subunit
MLSLFRAEWQKIASNRLVVGVFIWIFPMSALMLLIFATIAAFVSEVFRTSIVNAPPNWMDQLLFPWNIINSEIGRFLLVGLAGDVFGGEYQRMMWKNLLTRRPRVPLILNKFFTIGVYVLVAFIAMCAIVAVMSGVVTWAAGGSYGPALAEVSGEAWGTFLRVFGAQASVAFASVLIAACYAAVGAIFTRSILGAIVVGALLTFSEQAISVVFFLLSQLFENTDIMRAYLITPGYNLANISAQSLGSGPWTPPYMEQNGIAGLSVELSTVIALLWIIGLIGLTVYLFRRQDIMA